jgi:hypothetical protein
MFLLRFFNKQTVQCPRASLEDQEQADSLELAFRELEAENAEHERMRQIQTDKQAVLTDPRFAIQRLQAEAIVARSMLLFPLCANGQPIAVYSFHGAAQSSYVRPELTSLVFDPLAELLIQYFPAEMGARVVFTGKWTGVDEWASWRDLYYPIWSVVIG